MEGSPQATNRILTIPNGLTLLRAFGIPIFLWLYLSEHLKGWAFVVLVVGANDVVNPAAKTTPGCPIYGMPILDVASAGNVIFLKRSMRPGFAGIENELLYDPKTTLLFGDAKDSLTKVVSALKAL